MQSHTATIERTIRCPGGTIRALGACKRDVLFIEMKTSIVYGKTVGLWSPAVLRGLFGQVDPSVTSGTSGTDEPADGTSGTDGSADGTSEAGVKSVWNVSAGSEGL